VPLPPQPTRRAEPLLHRLAARRLICECEEGASVNAKKAERLSLRYGVLSKCTVFLAVDQSGKAVSQVASSSRASSAARGSTGGGLKFGSLLGSSAKGGGPGQRRRLSVGSVSCEDSSAGGGQLPHVSFGGVRREDSSDGGQPEKLSFRGIDSSDGDLNSAAPTSAARRSRAAAECVGPATGGSVSSEKELEQFLRLCAADGSFSHSSVFEACTGIGEQAVEAWRQQQWSSSADSAAIHQILFTALAIAVLRGRFHDHQSTWGLVAAKAKSWLSARAAEWQCDAAPDCDTLIQLAEGKLSM